MNLSDPHSVLSLLLAAGPVVKAVIAMLLVAPALRFARWRFAVASWTAFWAITLLLASTS